MFDLGGRLKALMFALKCRHGDVLVLTSRWRRLRGTEQWAIGDMLRIERIYVKGDGYCIGKMWAIVTHKKTPSVVGIEMFFGPAEAVHEDEFDAGDQGKRVPASQLPGYACAALAKWWLTGEKTLCHD